MQIKITLDDGTTIETGKVTLRVQAFKRSGKWNSTQCRELKSSQDLSFVECGPWSLAPLIEANDRRVAKFSPFAAGFIDGFYYVIEAFLPIETKGFCTMIVDKTEDKLENREKSEEKTREIEPAPGQVGPAKTGQPREPQKEVERQADELPRGNKEGGE